MKKNTLALCEAGIMIAFSTVLAMLKLIDMPYGGSVTFAQMLPILIFAYRHGPKYGMGAALTASVVQLLLGLENFSYLPLISWYSVVVLALLDYVVAYSAFGIVGFFKKKMDYSKAMVLGGLLASVIRYVCHVVSGFTAWTAFEIPSSAVLIYSLGYNATYMIPETIVLCAVAYFFCSSVDVSKNIPSRAKRQESESAISLMKILAGFAILVAVIVDTVLVFSHIQDGETGDFILSGLGEVNWIAFTVVTVVSVGVAMLFYILDKKKQKQK
ncbi:MAG: energy-coupled thiamine transporter ThiT [Clostridia bacterium]|nr:energy-coupled thiamine transporter ThiT [Clostridia bacterium]